jgi:hypothetical protein
MRTIKSMKVIENSVSFCLREPNALASGLAV